MVKKNVKSSVKVIGLCDVVFHLPIMNRVYGLSFILVACSSFFFFFSSFVFSSFFFEALSTLPIYYLIRKFVHSVSFLFLSFGSYRNLVNYYFKSSRLVFLTFSYHVHLHLSTFSQVMFNHLNIVYVFQSYLCSLSYANFSSTFS